jgi:hypothetical protein
VFSLREEEFDFRIRWQSAVRETGADWPNVAPTPAFDAEGEASPAFPQWSLAPAGPTQASMGADQVNAFRIEELTRDIDVLAQWTIRRIGVDPLTSTLMIAPPAQIGAGPALTVAAFQDPANPEFSPGLAIPGLAGQYFLDPATSVIGSSIVFPLVDAENFFPFAVTGQYLLIMQFGIVDPVNQVILLTEGQRAQGL